MAEKRKFTGAFIPAHIWVSKELIPAEKMMLGEIDCLSKETGWCYAGRKHFAEWLHCTPQNVTHYTNRLVELGYLEIVKVVGGTSRMRLKNRVESRTDGGGKPDFPGVESRTDGGGKPDFPKIQPKNNSEIQRQKQSAKNEFSPDATDDVAEYEVQVFEPVKRETIALQPAQNYHSQILDEFLALGTEDEYAAKVAEMEAMLQSPKKATTSSGARRDDLGEELAEFMSKEYGVEVVTVQTAEPVPETLGKPRKTRQIGAPQPFPETAAAFAHFSNPDKIAAVWKRWLEYKLAQHRERYRTGDSELIQLRKVWKLANGDADAAEQIIEQSVGNLWKGLFALKTENSNPNGKIQSAHEAKREQTRRELVEYYAGRAMGTVEKGWSI